MAIKDVPSILVEEGTTQSLDSVITNNPEPEIPNFSAKDAETGYFRVVDLRVRSKEAERYDGEVRFVDRNKRRYNIIFMLEFNRPFTPKYDDKGRYVGGRFLSANILSHNPVKWVIPYCQRDRLNGEDFGDKIIDFVMMHYKSICEGHRK